MKKFLISIVLAVTCLFFVCACNSSEPKVTASPEPAVITEIKTAYYNKHKDDFVSKYFTYTVDDISLDYYGEYNGAHIVYISAPCYGYTTAIEERKIDGVKIVYPTGQTLKAYYDGSFYSLEAAFENGFIDHGNLVDISKNFGNGSFFPYPPKSVVDRIKKSYYEIHKDNGWFENYTADDIGISFYGEYRGAYVMFIGPPIFAVSDVITVQDIDGVKIIYPTDHVMEVFYGGEFYSLETAFEKGRLTHDNLVDIRNKHKATHSYLYE